MFKDLNEIRRQAWLRPSLPKVTTGFRILDAGAGELKNRKYCVLLVYVSQDFCQYHGAEGGLHVGIQTPSWDTEGIDIVGDITAIPEPTSSFDIVLYSEVIEHFA